jgi:AAHS family 4-hydroxybenzoate transporter-like MFS transporter
MAVLIGTSLQVGGVIGTLTLGRFINRFGFTRVLGLLPAGLRVHCADRQGGGLPVLLFVAVIVAASASSAGSRRSTRWPVPSIRPRCVPPASAGRWASAASARWSGRSSAAS